MRGGCREQGHGRAAGVGRGPGASVASMAGLALSGLPIGLPASCMPDPFEGAGMQKRF